MEGSVAGMLSFHWMVGILQSMPTTASEWNRTSTVDGKWNL
jgi:hypothetical protein